MDYRALVTKMLVFFALLTIGYLSRRKGAAGPEFTGPASRLLLNVFVVATIINSVLGDKPELQRTELLKVIAIITVTEIVIYVVSGIISRTVYRHDKNAPQKEILLALVNALFVGLPIVQELCGKEGALYFGLNTIPFFILLYSYGVLRLSRSSGGSKVAIREMFKSPPLLGTLAALVLFCFSVSVPDFVGQLCAMLAAVTTPLALIIVGATVGGRNMTSFLKDKNVWFLCFVRLLLTPLLVYLIVSRLTDNISLLISCVVIAATPPGVLCTPLSVKYGYDAQFSSNLIAMSTLLSMVTIPLLLIVLF